MTKLWNDDPAGDRKERIRQAALKSVDTGDHVYRPPLEKRLGFREGTGESCYYGKGYDKLPAKKIDPVAEIATRVGWSLVWWSFLCFAAGVFVCWVMR